MDSNGKRKLYISNLLSLLIYHTCHVTSKDFPDDLVSHLCPYTDFCHLKASEVLQDPKFAPCCSSCSCDDDCWETQRCCPDMVDVKNKTTNLVCKRTMVKKKTTMLGFTDNGYKIPKYFITDKCPDTEKDEIIRKACAGEVVTSLQDIIWVTDTASGKIYQNSHCALCHNVKQWKNWNIRSSSCTAFLNATDDNLAHVLFSSDCTLLNEVPESEQSIVDKYRCFIPDIFSCNQTGLWQHYDPYIADRCQKYNGWFFEAGLFEVTIHKNPYCFICNKGSQTHTSRCQGSATDERTTPGGFNALLDFIETKHAITPKWECATDEMWDKYMSRCRTLICPFGSIPFNGNCKPRALEMIDFGLYIRFRLEVDEMENGLISVADNLTLLQENGNNIIKPLFRALGLKRCPLCMKKLSAENNGPRPISHLFAILEIETKSGCQLDTIFKKIAEVQHKKLKVDLKDRVHLAMSVHLTEEPQNDENVLLFLEASGSKCVIYLDITKTPCPEIELGHDEVTSYDDDKVTLSLSPWFTDIRGHNDTTNARICVSDYLRLMSMGRRSTAGHVNVSLLLPFVLLAFAYVFSAGMRLQ